MSSSILLYRIKKKTWKKKSSESGPKYLLEGNATSAAWVRFGQPVPAALLGGDIGLDSQEIGE